jgi:hypothetical protein
MLYLATFELELTHYMETDSERTKLIRLVEADSIEEAELKLKQHFKCNSLPENKYNYSVYISVNNFDINEIIK